MAKWLNTIDIRAEWKQAEKEEIKPFELAAIVAEKMRALLPSPFDYVNSRREELIDSFDALFEFKCSDWDEFDIYLDELYDWGDIAMFPGKNCWVATV